MKSRIEKRLREIEKVGPPSTRGDLLRLRGLLADKHYQVRQAVAENLGHSDKKACVPILVHVLRDPHHRVRAAAAQSLGWIGDVRAVPYLAHVALYDPDSDASLSAILALQWINDISAAPGLFRVVGHHVDPVIRKAAMGALVQFGRKLDPFLVRVVRDGKRAYRLIAAEIRKRIAESDATGPSVLEKPSMPLLYTKPTRVHLPTVIDENVEKSGKNE